MRARLFWKLGLTYIALLLGVLVTVDLYSARVLRREYLRSAKEKLASLLKLAQARPPHLEDPAQLQYWAEYMAQSGARVTVIDNDGNVLAESARDPETLENHLNRPEVQQALSTGTGESVRHSKTVDLDLVYRAVLYQQSGRSPVIIRMALPLGEIDSSLAELRGKLLLASLVILAIGTVASLGFSQMFATRVQRLKDFSRRVAEGDFRPLLAEEPRDELADLGEALNETAKHLDLEIRLLSSERNRSSAILRSMVEGVAVIDAQERLVFCNRAFSEILNLDSASTEGRPLIELVRISELLTLIRRALKGEEGLQNDIAMGIVQQRSFVVTAAPVNALDAGPGSSGAAAEKPSGAVVVLHDVTELRRLERVRQDFVANVSHEFKTPLTAIQGFAETLLAGALDDPNNNRRFLEIIRDHAARLARLTDDLLKLARIEAGKLELEFSSVGLTELIEGCAETTLLKASRKQIALEINIPPGLPAVRGDSSLLRDVLQNLLDNAIQYTPAGGRIQVSATAGAGEAVVTVADTGIGIPLAEQERIFERFYRVDAARSREAGGTGLGLSIAKHIVEAHGGRLWVESTVGSGSQFSFSIPVAT
ncbi:MAG TPA: ATP-binding protein [Candidatus Limnocylindria bacterium]|nr:ATP-binding protein [Candidatus Limnocylindria bacterium]